MNPERWNEVKNLLGQAIELPPGEIEPFLDRSCGEDPELRAEVEALVEVDEHVREFLERPALGEQAAPPTPVGTSTAERPAMLVELVRQFEATEAPRAGQACRFDPGTVLDGRYRIVHLVGRGGMGEVYRADDLKLEQPVALKFLPELAEGDEEMRARLLEEVRIARQVAHPNVCRVYDIGEMDSHLFLSMELIEGEDLASLLRRIGRLTQEKALELAWQLAAGLAAVHEQGVLHCDLKPVNLMIDSRGRLRITDFGIARAAGSPSGTGHGTPAYMAPEQLTGTEASQKSDIYALGLVMYELFTGLPAFESETDTQWGRLHREVTPQPPSLRVTDIDPAVEKLILSCLEKDPDKRPALVSEIVHALSVSHVASRSLPRRTLLVGDLGPGRNLEGLHQRVLTRLLEEHRGHEIERVDGTLQLLFDRPIQAVRYALDCHRVLRRLSEEEGSGLRARIGIHLCEVSSPEDASSLLAPPEGVAETGEEVTPEKLASWPKVVDLDTAELLSSLAGGGQTLMTRDAFDSARQSTAAGLRGVRWLAHGNYEMAGFVKSLEIYEVGVEGVAPLRAPDDTTKGRRRMVQETISGWRPAPGQDLPQRPNWTVERRLGEGGFGEVWLVVHRKTRERRVFKFCYDPVHLRSLQREITLFRLLKETLGERDDITRVLDWNFDEPPYFIESEYTAGGNLAEWAESEGGLERIPLATRLDVVAQVARALSAAHSVGVLHKDVKPGNVLVTTTAEGRVRARLSDFGVGLVTEQQRLLDAGITLLGMTETANPGPGSGGTRLYMAPELLEGKPASLQADVYALGVVLYQMVVGDFSRALAPGWDRGVADELLREDIAAAVDGSPEERLSSASQLAERLYTLEHRRERRAARRRQEEEARQLRLSLAVASRRRQRAAWIIAGLALFATVTTALLYFVKQEATRANREAESVKELSDLLVDVIGSSDPYQPSIDKVTARATLDRGALRIESKLQNQPLIRATMMHSIGTIYMKLGTYDPARQFLESALEIRREVHGDRNIEVVESLKAVAEVLTETAELDRAEELIREALELRREIKSDKPPCVVDCMVQLGEILFLKGQLDSADAMHREVLRLRRESSGKESCSTTAADSIYGLTAVLNAKEDFAGSEEIYRKLLQEQISTLGRRHPDVVLTMNSLALTLVTKGERLDEAEDLYEEALETSREILGPNHPDTAVMVNNLAHLLQKRGKYSEAERLFKESLSMFEQGLGENHPNTAFTKYSLARLYRSMGDPEQARRWLTEALAIYRKVLGEDHPEIAVIEADMKDLLDQAD